jgi:hypothetical protein
MSTLIGVFIDASMSVLISAFEAASAPQAIAAGNTTGTDTGKATPAMLHQNLLRLSLSLTHVPNSVKIVPKDEKYLKNES